MRITIVAVGSRGDVQPYVALGKGLRQAGHTVCIATHLTFEAFVRAEGLDFAPMVGNPRELLESAAGQAWLASGANPVAFLRGLARLGEPLMAQAGEDTLNACADAEAILYSSLGLGALHVAEALGVPSMPALYVPSSRTRAFPTSLMSQDLRLGGVFNQLSHRLVEQLLWQPFRAWVNRWRVERLGLRPLPFAGPYGRLVRARQPVLYGYSPLVAPRPRDWGPWLHVTGYWLLRRSPAEIDAAGLTAQPQAPAAPPLAREGREAPANVAAPGRALPWPGPANAAGPVSAAPMAPGGRGGEAAVQTGPDRVPAGLVEFLAAGPPPVYVGFGSLTAADPRAQTDLVVEALQRSGQRGVLLVGWGGLTADGLPDDVFAVGAVPHDWLFPRLAAVVHHGGASTTAEGLRAGVPSILVPFFADQPFWASRVGALGVGPRPIPRRELTVGRLVEAIRRAVDDQALRARAARLGAAIRAEDGVGRAVAAFHRELPRAARIVRAAREAA